MPGFFSADALDVAGFGVVGLLANVDFDPVPVPLELRCFSADEGLATLEFDLFPLDNDELERDEPDAAELNRLLVEPPP